jgi:hypothetical protein
VPTAASTQEPSLAVGEPTQDVPPLVYEWSRFPRLPLPTLVAAHDRIKAAAVAGCITRVYEPRNDAYGRSTQFSPACLTGPLPRTAPLAVAAGAALSVRAPDGYVLGAELADSSEAYAAVYGSGSIPARIDGVGLGGSNELTRETGFKLLQIEFFAPTEPGDYLITVAAQLGTADGTYREFDTAFLFRLRVVAG